MGVSVINNDYFNYLNNTISIKTGRLRINENVNGEVKVYSLIDCNNNVIYDGFDNIINLGFYGFICTNKNNIKKMVHYTVDGKEVSSSDQYYTVDLHEEYFRAMPEGCVDSTGEYFDYKTGRFYPPFVGDNVVEIFYDRDCPINVAKITKDDKVCYKYFTKDNYRFCFDDAEFTYATPFKNGLATVCVNNTYYAIDQNGDNVFDKTFLYLGNFEEGLAPYSEDGKLFGYIDSLGQIFVQPDFNKATDFKDGIATVTINKFLHKSHIKIDLLGNEIKVFPNDEINMIIEKEGYRYYDKYNGRYSSIKYPIVKHYEEFILCKADEGLTFFSKKTGDYLLLVEGDVDKNNINLLDRLLVIGDKYYYISSNGKCIDLTGHIDINQVVSIGEYVNENTSIYNFNEFSQGLVPVTKEETLEVIDEKQEEAEVIEEVLDDEEVVSDGFSEVLVVNNDLDFNSIHNRVLEEKRMIESEKDILLRQIEDLNNKLEELNNRSHGLIDVTEDILFNDLGEYKEIKEELLEDLVYLNLSNISFDNVKVSGINLSYINGVINPQTVYNKDMSNGCYDGVKFTSNDFTGVNTDNSTFKDCDVPFGEFDITEIL